MKINIIQLILEDLEKELDKRIAIEEDLEKAIGIQIAINMIKKNKERYLKQNKNFMSNEFFNNNEDPFALSNVNKNANATSVRELLISSLVNQDFESQYKKAKTFKEKIICKIVNITNGTYRDVLGRTILLEKDYEQMKKEYTRSNGKIS